MSLHRILTIVMTAIAALAVATSISLVTLASYLGRTTTTLTSATNATRLAEEMEVDLLMHARSGDALDRAVASADLRRKLTEIERYVPDPRHRAALRMAYEDVHNYLNSAGAGPLTQDDEKRLVAAFRSLEQVVDGAIQQTERTLEEAKRWDVIGDWLGLGATVALLLAAAALLIWLRFFAFRSVLETRNAMRRFASGMREARAPETGPEELRNIAAQFNEMADALSRQRERQAEFLAAVAHDLRNPLSNLKMSAGILSSNQPVDRNRLDHLSRLISRQVDALDRMVGDLLDSSRIEAGQLELRFQRQDARTLLQNVYELFQSSSPAHHLVLSAPDGPTPIYCDPARIEQVLNNIVSNAIKYSPSGGTIRLSLTRCGGAAVFTVSDTGVGISPEELPHIFEPFRRGRVSKDAAPGVGLGLAAARRIVHAHGGQIDVTSELGRGTTVTVSLQLEAYAQTG